MSVAMGNGQAVRGPALATLAIPAALEPPRALAWATARDRLRKFVRENPATAGSDVLIESLDVTATQRIEQGWQHEEFPPVMLDDATVWRTAAAANRSWGFHLHTWSFLDPVLREYQRSHDPTLLRWCLDRARSWVLAHRTLDSAEGGAMAWYDMALALRAPRLVLLFREALVSVPDDAATRDLYETALLHQRALGTTTAFNPRNNHGFYTALGQLIFAADLRPLPGMRALWAQGRQRLAHVAAGQFLDDGGHAEHSPAYHQMLLRDFALAERHGLLADRTVAHRLRLARRALSWMVQPDETLVQFGDTPRTLLERDLADPRQPSGEDRAADTAEVALLHSSGYAFARDLRHGSYLAMMAAFHSRAHKHADDATMIWWDRGQEWLTDAGRFGYHEQLPPDSPLRQQGFYYATPERQYVETTRAHNTVECDGRDHARRGREPYGSGVTGAEERSGHVLLGADVNHGHWHHRRRLVHKPGAWLLVVDEVSTNDDDSHDFRVWFNMPGELTVHTTASGTVRVLSEARHEPLWVRSLSSDILIRPVRGVAEPALRGWRSVHDREVVPAWSFGFELGSARSHRFATLFAFGSEPPELRPHPFLREVTAGGGPD